MILATTGSASAIVAMIYAFIFIGVPLFTLLGYWIFTKNRKDR